jgi:hypothetical protein
MDLGIEYFPRLVHLREVNILYLKPKKVEFEMERDSADIRVVSVDDNEDIDLTEIDLTDVVALWPRFNPSLRRICLPGTGTLKWVRERDGNTGKWSTTIV